MITRLNNVAEFTCNISKVSENRRMFNFFEKTMTLKVKHRTDNDSKHKIQSETYALTKMFPDDSSSSSLGNF